VADPDPQHPTRTDIDAPISAEDASPGASPRSEVITGRDFAGTTRASDQNEQTADHRGESRRHMADDVLSEPEDPERGLAPRDES
jgi:hypothetical protein